MFDVLMKQSFTFCRGFTLRSFTIKTHVVMIDIRIYSAACGAVIAEPSIVEAPALPPRNERTKARNGNLKPGKTLLQKCVNVLGPFSSNGMNGTKFRKDGGTENATSSCMTAAVNSSIA